MIAVASLSGPLHPHYASDLDAAVIEPEPSGFRVRRAPLPQAGRNHWWSAARPAQTAAEVNALLRHPESRAVIALRRRPDRAGLPD